MSRKSPSNVAASVQQRLLNKSRKEGEDYQHLLTRFALERYLYRLGLSPHKEKFILKGAMLFPLWDGELHRPTRDMDLHGIGEAGITHLEAVFREICLVGGEDDGLRFLPETVRGQGIREDQEYDGVRIPMGLSEEFGNDSGKQTQWRAFLRKGRFADELLSLGEVVSSLREFLIPPSAAISRKEMFELHWLPPGPWRE